MRELPDSLFPLIDRVFIDSLQAPEEAGDLVVPIKKKILNKESICTLGKLITGNTDRGGKPTRFFKSVGMAIFDIVVAKRIYELACEKGMGTEISM